MLCVSVPKKQGCHDSDACWSGVRSSLGSVLNGKQLNAQGRRGTRRAADGVTGRESGRSLRRYWSVAPRTWRLLQHMLSPVRFAGGWKRGGKNPSPLSLKFSEVKSKRKSVVLKKQGGRKKGKLKQSLRDTEAQRAGGFCHPLCGEKYSNTPAFAFLKVLSFVI